MGSPLPSIKNSNLPPARKSFLESTRATTTPYLASHMNHSIFCLRLQSFLFFVAGGAIDALVQFPTLKDVANNASKSSTPTQQSIQLRSDFAC